MRALGLNPTEAEVKKIQQEVDPSGKGYGRREKTEREGVARVCGQCHIIFSLFFPLLFLQQQEVSAGDMCFCQYG